jgi:hypothetical protein
MFSMLLKLRSLGRVLLLLFLVFSSRKRKAVVMAAEHEVAGERTAVASLSSLGLKFDGNSLISVSDGLPFRFRTAEHYDAVGAGVLHNTQEQMISLGLKQTALTPSIQQSQSFVFTSIDLSTSPVICVFVQGLGAVRKVIHAMAQEFSPSQRIILFAGQAYGREAWRSTKTSIKGACCLTSDVPCKVDFEVLSACCMHA